MRLVLLLVLFALAACTRASSQRNPGFVYRPGMTAKEVLAESPKDCRVSRPNERTTVIDCGPFFPGAYAPHSCEGDCGEGALTIVAQDASMQGSTYIESTGPLQIGDGNTQYNIVRGGSTSYTMLAQECGHHIVEQNGTPVRDFNRCDPEFDGCFAACGAYVSHRYPGIPGSDAEQAAMTKAATACVDECDRRYPVTRSPGKAYVDLGDAGSMKGMKVDYDDAGSLLIHPEKGSSR